MGMNAYPSYGTPGETIEDAVQKFAQSFEKFLHRICPEEEVEKAADVLGQRIVKNLTEMPEDHYQSEDRKIEAQAHQAKIGFWLYVDSQIKWRRGPWRSHLEEVANYYGWTVANCCTAYLDRERKLLFDAGNSPQLSAKYLCNQIVSYKVAFEAFKEITEERPTRERTQKARQEAELAYDDLLPKLNYPEARSRIIKAIRDSGRVTYETKKGKKQYSERHLDRMLQSYPPPLAWPGPHVAFLIESEGLEAVDQKIDELYRQWERENVEIAKSIFNKLHNEAQLKGETLERTELLQAVAREMSHRESKRYPEDTTHNCLQGLPHFAQVKDWLDGHRPEVKFKVYPTPVKGI